MAVYSNQNSNIQNKKRAYQKRVGIIFLCVFIPIFINLVFNIIKVLNSLFLGVFGLSFYAINLAFIVLGILLIMGKNIELPKISIVYGVLALSCLILILQVLTTLNISTNFGEYIDYIWQGKLTCGGVLFGLIVYPFYLALDSAGTGVLFAILLVAFSALFIDVCFVNSNANKARVITKDVQEKTNLKHPILEEEPKEDEKPQSQKQYDENIFVKDNEKEEKIGVTNAENSDKDRERILSLLGLNKKKQEEEKVEPEEENKNLLYTKNDIFKLNNEYDEKKEEKKGDKPPVFIHTEDELDANPTTSFVFNEKPQPQMSEKERLNREFLSSINGKAIPKPTPVQKPKNNDIFANKPNMNYDYNPYEQNDKFSDDLQDFFGNPMKEYGAPNTFNNQNPFAPPQAFNSDAMMNPSMGANNSNPYMNNPINQNSQFGFDNNSFDNGFNQPFTPPNFQPPNNQQSSYVPNKNKFGYDDQTQQDIISSMGETEEEPAFKKPNFEKSKDKNGFVSKFGYTDDAKDITIENEFKSSKVEKKEEPEEVVRPDIYDEHLTKKSYNEHKQEYIDSIDKVNKDLSSFEDKPKQDFSKQNRFDKSSQITIDQVSKEEQKPVEEKKVPKYKKPPEYKRPPIDLLEIRKSQNDTDDADLADKAKVLEETLSNFKIPAKVCSILKGPAFTRFEMQMPAGVSVTKITNYIDDIQMPLMCLGKIKTEIPIPGKNAFGVEVPNKVIDTVGLRDILESNAFTSSKSLLTFGLGKDISGDCLVARLEKMPHLLVAGQTGSGKSVGINSLICSILYKASPQDVKFILVDPKQVEFTFYNGLPHLLTRNVITEVDKAISAFAWTINEMERRYMNFKNFAVRNIEEYNETDEVKNGFNEKMPYIIIIVDELADLMTQAKKDLEDKIMRLAAKARAAGIHLVLATQRPSVDVITGTIKANLPARIAFAVQAPQDSKTILNVGGAERLLGKGDMLYQPSDSPELKRIQGAFLSNEEIKKIVSYIKENNEADFDEEIEKAMFSKSGGGYEVNQNEEEFDPLLKDSLRIAIKTNSISISKLQRAFGIGYPRAGKIVDQMERGGMISPPDTKNVRSIYVTQQEFEERFGEDL